MLFWLTFINFSLLNICSVIELTDENFEASLQGKNVFVMFYSPNCGHCKRLKPTYETLATKSNIIESGVLIAKVDCTDKGKSACSHNSVNGFPTLKFFNFNGGKQIITDYDGNRELDDLEYFVLSNNRDPITEIKDSEINNFIISRTRPVIIAFISDQNSKILSTLKNLAPQYKNDYLMGFSYSKEKAKELGKEMDTINFYRQIHYKSKLEDQMLTIKSEKDISTFLNKNKLSLVEFRTRKNVDAFKSPHITVFIKFDPYMKKSAIVRLRNILLKQAKKINHIHFSISLASDFGEFLSEISPSSGEDDIVIFGTDKNDKKFVCPEFVKFDDHRRIQTVLDKFITDFSAGNVLKPYIKSQPADTPDDGHVKVVTALNFNELVMENEKDVLIEFYAPWCGHCKKLAPIYQQLATMLKDEPNLVVAKYDATANEQQKGYEIQGFPTIFFAKSGKKNSPLKYEGNRDAQSILNFIKKNSKHSVKFDGKIPEIKEEL